MISIIVATFKRTRYLKEAIESILNQSGVDFEIVAVPVAGDVDDIAILNSYDDSRIRVICSDYALITRQKNLGFYNSSNKSEYIMCFDSDDVMLSNSLRSLYEYASTKDLDIAYPDFYIGREDLSINRTKKCSDYSHRSLMEGCYITDVSMVKREAFKEYLPMKVSDGKMRFYNIWKRMSGDGRKIGHFPYPTFIYRQHKSNIHLKKYKSQNNSSYVRIGSNDNFASFYKRIPAKNMKDITTDDFCIYFPDPYCCLENMGSCLFKKIVVHWAPDNIILLKKFVDIPNIYHVFSDVNMLGYFVDNRIRKFKLVDSSSALETYLLEEEYTWR